MEQVDQRIGQVVAALPADVAENTVIVFTSDHGEYAGAHGFLSGKVGSAYKEIFDVPLIVHDPSGRFVAEPEVVRDGLVSSVDMLRLLVTIGHKGSQHWLKGEYEEIYGKRLDVAAMLQSAKAPGRPMLCWRSMNWRQVGLTLIILLAIFLAYRFRRAN